jgi:hypothetical protein
MYAHDDAMFEQRYDDSTQRRMSTTLITIQTLLIVMNV